MNEIWKDVSGYDGIYQVSNFGNVKRTRGRQGDFSSGGILMSLSVKPREGYLRVRLTAAELGKREFVTVHRLVAKAFIPKKTGKNCVNHIDCNPSNNHVSNLEWCTQGENIRHSRKLGRYNKPQPPSEKQKGDG